MERAAASLTKGVAWKGGCVQVPARFEYEKAGTVAEAIELLERHGEGAYLLAGGHSLIPMMKLRLAAPETVIDIGELDGELRYIADEGGVLKIGALTRHRELLESPLVRERYTLLVDAERMIADPLVRNMGTVGGALSHGDPAEDLPAAFVALGAEVVARGPGGERTVAVDELYGGPYQTVLEHGEVLTEVRVPRAPQASAYSKVERRAGDYASAALGVALRMEGDTIHEVRIGLCGVGPTTLRARRAEEVLRGERPGAELYRRTGERAAQESDPIEDARGTVEYKRDLVRVLLERTVAKAVERAAGGGR
jgi:carbon-monoxide dehydrogenase medium subunit